MFQRTRIRLAALNSIILFIILTLFGGILYLYTYNRMYTRVDESLWAVANHLEQTQFGDLTRSLSFGRQADRTVVYVLWDKDGQLIQQVPPQAFLASDVDKLRPKSPTENLRTITTVDGHKYRSLTYPITAETKSNNLETIQLVLDIDPEANFLSDLLIIVLVGGFTGVGVSLLAGFFLANRALIPIKETWDKQQQFIADASHELRTPLSVIQGQLEVLFRHPDHTIEQDSEKISTVLLEVKRISKMVSQLLTLARSDSSPIGLEKKDFCFAELIRDTTAQFSQLVATKEINLETSVDSSISFYGDKERLHQLLIILLDNAVKYTPIQGSIKVIAKHNRHEIKIEIVDTGMGIAENDLPYIFDRFYRGDKVRERSSGGTGLGLAIAKWIVNAHNGTIWAESKVSMGTCIHLLFPVKRNS